MSSSYMKYDRFLLRKVKIKTKPEIITEDEYLIKLLEGKE